MTVLKKSTFILHIDLYRQNDDKIMYLVFKVVNQFLSADVKTWVKTLHIYSWVRLQSEMIAYYVNLLEEDRAWSPLKLQQTESAKYYSETFLQIFLNVGNNFTEKDKHHRHVEGLQDEIRKVIRVGMVDGRYTIFSQEKSAAEELDLELWWSHRKTNTAGS
jgi:hypothetical protein